MQFFVSGTALWLAMAAPQADTNANSADPGPSEQPAGASGETAPSEAEPSATPSESAPTAVEGSPPSDGQTPATQPVAPEQPAVSDEAWNAMVERDVVVETSSGEVPGKLLSVGDNEVVIAGTDGRITTVRKTDATGLRLGQPQPQPQPQPEPEPQPQPQAEPPPAYEPSPPPPQPEPPPPKPEKKYAKLGLYTAHGGGYAYWSGEQKEGTGAYAFDVGLGINFNERFGLYALGGGLVGGKIFDKDVKANYFHVAPMLAFRGKYIGSMFGLGGAFSSIVASDSSFKDAGLAIPTKIFGIIPLPKNLYIGIGLGYDFAAVNKFDILFHGISGQVAVGRW